MWFQLSEGIMMVGSLTLINWLYNNLVFMSFVQGRQFFVYSI